MGFMGYVCNKCNKGMLQMKSFLDGTRLESCSKCDFYAFEFSGGGPHTRKKVREGCEKFREVHNKGKEKFLTSSKKYCRFCEEKDCKKADKFIYKSVFKPVFKIEEIAFYNPKKDKEITKRTIEQLKKIEKLSNEEKKNLWHKHSRWWWHPIIRKHKKKEGRFYSFKEWRKENEK